jgi:hypothetical protein
LLDGGIAPRGEFFEGGFQGIFLLGHRGGHPTSRSPSIKPGAGGAGISPFILAPPAVMPWQDPGSALVKGMLHGIPPLLALNNNGPTHG